MPGATETEFFERANMMDTKVGTQEKDHPADVAKDGFEAMMKGEGDVVSGWKNKLQDHHRQRDASEPARRAASQDRRAWVGKELGLVGELKTKYTEPETRE